MVGNNGCPLNRGNGHRTLNEALLGHKEARTTQRYAHLADDPLRAVPEAIGRRIAVALGGEVSAKVVNLSHCD